MIFSTRNWLVPLLGLAFSLLTSCGGAETTRFEVRLALEPCKEANPDLSRIQLLVLPVTPQGTLCQLTSTEVTASEQSKTLPGGELDYEEVVLLALAYNGDDDCVQCRALARVQLDGPLTQYALDLQPTAGCSVPGEDLQGLGLPQDALPAPACAQ